MSYIRASENPEGLYVVGTGKFVEIYEGHKGLCKVPAYTFQRLGQKWAKDGMEMPVSFRGLVLTDAPEGKVQLMYKTWDKPIAMYQSTLVCMWLRFLTDGKHH